MTEFFASRRSALLFPLLFAMLALGVAGAILASKARSQRIPVVEVSQPASSSPPKRFTTQFAPCKSPSAGCLKPGAIVQRDTIPFVAPN